MVEILLKDGTKFEMKDNEWTRFYKRVNLSWNIRHFILDNGNQMYMDDRCPIMFVTMGEPDVKPEPVQEKVAEDAKEDIVEHMKQHEKKESNEQHNDRMLKEMMEKSNCTHKESDAILYKQDTKTGLKYFYVCGFCGKRERFVKKDDLVEKGINLETARTWIGE